MKERRYIIDTTLRDGEQSPCIAMTKEQKVAIAMILDEIGIYQIEAGIPAMGKYEKQTIYEIMENCKNSKIATWNRLNTSDIEHSFECKPHVIHISIPVSYVQIYTKLKKNKTWVMKKARECVELATSKGYEVTVGFEDASRADIGFMIALIKLLKELQVKIVRFADTVGVMSPARMADSISEIILRTGIDVAIHAHNDFGMATANSIVAAKSGAKYIDTTILGIGERAGNCNFTEFVYASEKLFDLQIPFLTALVAEEKILNLLNMKGNSYDE